MVKQTAKGVAVSLLAILLAGCPDDFGKLRGKPDPSPVAPPTNLAASVSGSFEVQLTWNDNAVGEGGYRLEISPTGFGPSTLVEFMILPADRHAYSYGGSPGKVYHFRVFAVTDTLQSDASNEVMVDIPRVYIPPAWVGAVSEAPDRATVSWSYLDGESGFYVEISADGGSTWSIAAVTAADRSSVVISGLTGDREYLFRVLTEYWYGPGDPSNSVGIVTLTRSASLRSVSYADSGIGLSFVRAASGVDYISCYEAGTSSVHLLTELGYQPGSSIWSGGVVDPGPTGVEDVGGDGTSVVLDGAGKAHILAHDRTNNTLRWATNPSGWTAATIDAGPGGARPRIAWNPVTGALHAVYQYSSSQLKHLVKAPGQPWGAAEILNVQIDSSSMHALGVDATGAVHVVLINSLKELVYGAKPPATGVWVFQTLPLTPSTMKPDSVSMALDSGNAPHFAIHDGLSGSLHHLTKVLGDWTMEIIDHTPGADVGGGPSLTIHPATGRLHVAYYDATRGDLRYARKEVNAGWTRRLIDAVGNVGSNAAINVDAAGLVSIAYRDETQRVVKLARGTP